MAGGKVFSFEEVRKHSDRKDCWLIINGKVYDVTAFMEEHPGGDEVLLACTGKDATADFEDIGHSESAKEMMPQYCIGELDAATIPARLVHAFAASAAKAPTPTPAPGKSVPGFWLTALQLVVPLLLVAMAFLLQNLAKTKTE